jgi:hypothetical protein
MTDRPQSGDASHFAEMLLRKTMGEGRLIKVPLETDTTPPAGDDAAAIREAAERLTCAEDIYSEYLKNSDLTDDLEDQMYDDIRLVARACLEAQAREARLTRLIECAWAEQCGTCLKEARAALAPGRAGAD